MSFNKRISLVKKEVFQACTETKELDNIKGTNTIGFYSLATIEKYLNPLLDKYDLDLDLEIFPDKIVGHWYDCNDDKQRDIEIDFHRIMDVGKLQLMAHEVQSEGAVKSYTRRYALTAILRLPSTDLIDNDNFRGNSQSNAGTSRTVQSNQDYKVTQAQLKRYYAISKNKGFEDMNYLDELIKAAFNLTSKNDWMKSDYDSFIKFMEGAATTEETIDKLLLKIAKAGKKAPEKKSSTG